MWLFKGELLKWQIMINFDLHLSCFLPLMTATKSLTVCLSPWDLDNQASAGKTVKSPVFMFLISTFSTYQSGRVYLPSTNPSRSFFRGAISSISIYKSHKNTSYKEQCMWQRFTKHLSRLIEISRRILFHTFGWSFDDLYIFIYYFLIAIWKIKLTC